MPDTPVTQALKTSQVLTLGEVYSRPRLCEMFDITDATINTGIFQPKGHDSVWLFVTESKTPDRTQYVDLLEGDVLHWQGQSKGRKDALIREHRQRGLELLLFYRHSKYEFPQAGFRYEGPFSYVSDEGEQPASFVLTRERTDQLAVAQEIAQHKGEFDPHSIEDARNRTVASIVRRRGQPAFRQQLLSAYSGRCAISGCDIDAVLEAAHIFPYQGAETNVVSNGLLIRADLHTLFDLGWLTIDAEANTVIVHASLQNSDYGQWHNKTLRLPADPAQRPSRAALSWHCENIGQ